MSVALSFVQPRKGDGPLGIYLARCVSNFSPSGLISPLSRYVPIQRLPRDAGLGTPSGDLGLGFTHCRLAKPKFCWRHLERTPAMLATRTNGSEAGTVTFDEKFALELGEAGKDREDQPVVRGSRVDRRAFTRQHLELNTAFGSFADRVDEVGQIAPELCRASRSRACRRGAVPSGRRPALALVEPPQRGVLIDTLGIDARRDQRIALEVVDPAAVRLDTRA